MLGLLFVKSHQICQQFPTQLGPLSLHQSVNQSSYRHLQYAYLNTMKKFGFGKKQSDGGDDANRAALFGKKGSPAPASDNPYAQSQPADDPYMNDTNKFAHMTPYQQARAGLQDRPVGLPSGPGPRSGYGGPPPRSSPRPAGRRRHGSRRGSAGTPRSASSRATSPRGTARSCR